MTATILVKAQTNNFPLYSYGSYSGGTGDYTDISNAQLRLQSTSGTYIRVPFVSSHGTVSTVFNFESGKHVFWGEPADAGTYWFRGRSLNVEQGNLLIPNGSIGLGTVSPSAWFPGRLLEMNDVRPILKMNSNSPTGLSTILFTNTSVNSSNHYGEFHFNYQFNQTNNDQSILSIGTYPGGTTLAMRADGKVGIGTQTLAQQTKLHVVESGSSIATWRGRIVSSGDNAAVVMGEWGNKASIGGHNPALNAWSDLYLQHGGGNVAIGTLNLGAQTKLHVYETGSSTNMWRGRIVSSGDGSAVVMGEVNGKASLGGHNAALTAWSDLCVNWGGGNVGIGTQNPTQKLTVNGTIYGKEVKVDLNVPGPDYVFEKDYKLTSLDEIKSYIDQHKHLPEVPSAKEMEQNGINVSEMNMILLKKVEELTLMMIQIKAQTDQQIQSLKAEIAQSKN
jgi:hypothetical protein